MKMKGSYKLPLKGCVTQELVCDMKMKGSYKKQPFTTYPPALVCDMKMNGRYKVEYKAYFVCDMEVEKY